MTASLTPRQRRIASLVADGRSNREIAALLGVSEATVKVDLRIVFSAWGCTERTQVAARVGRQAG